jgi:hypothetical protein
MVCNEAILVPSKRISGMDGVVIAIAIAIAIGIENSMKRKFQPSIAIAMERSNAGRTCSVLVLGRASV